MFLLDTNAWIEFLRGTNNSLLLELSRHSRKDIFLCSVVISELQFGVLRSHSARKRDRQDQLAELRSLFQSIPLDDEVAVDAAGIRFNLAATGRPIGPNDLLIAATARSRGLTLVTHNISEFSRVPGLVVEDWQSA